MDIINSDDNSFREDKKCKNILSYFRKIEF